MVISCHEHLANRRSSSTWEEDDRLLIEAADKLGIDQLCCSILTPRRPAGVEGFRECNEWVADAMQRYPDRVLGYCYVNPGHQREALEEIRRCIEDRGFMEIKLYNEYRCNEPVVWPVVELTVELGVPILQHAGHSHYRNDAQPRISDAGMIAELAERYPEAIIICGHLGGGGDWEWTAKALRPAPNAYMDTSGSVVDDGMIEMAARIMGVERLLFGCDMSMTAGLGKIRGADLTDRARRRILGQNMQRIMAARKGGSTC
jgi:predicted TIM-barrel fold metal-dependent hydrolase